MDAVSGAKVLLRNNQPDGFDCPGLCLARSPSIPRPSNSARTAPRRVTWEATKKRATPEVFTTHTVTELLGWADHDIENLGRLTHPMVYDAASDRYVEIAWDDAFARIAAALNALPDPNMAEFYTSGRASNEAAFLLQLFRSRLRHQQFPPTAPICATRRRASAWRRPSASARAASRSRISTMPPPSFPSATTPAPTIRA